MDYPEHADVRAGLVDGLTRDGAAATVAGRILVAPPARWLGRVSYALYLVHMPLQQYVAFALNGVRPAQPDCDEDDEDECDALRTWRKKGLIPPWAIAPVVLASVVLAALLVKFVETPARDWFRGKKH